MESDAGDDDEQELFQALLQRGMLRRKRAQAEATFASEPESPTHRIHKKKRRFRRGCVRRNGWNPKARHGSQSLSKAGTADAWKYDTSKCIWWALLDDPETLVE